DRHAAPAERARQDEVEVGKVDRDQNIGTRPLGVGDQPAVGRPGARQERRHLEEPGHRQSAEVRDERRAGLAQAIAGEADDCGRRYDAPDLAREDPGIQIARGLAARDHDAHGRLDRLVQLGLTKSAASSGTLTSNVRTTRSTVGAPDRVTTVRYGTL